MDTNPEMRLDYLLQCVKGIKAQMEFGIDEIVKVATKKKLKALDEL